ncbi:MAG: response regulator transcription factor [Chloroflexi bacterium]|nr:response regulator transcription factor [Chloroflexota bacterium]
MSEVIQILIADDHAIVREGLRALIATEPGMEVVGEAADGVQTVQLALTLQPDIILLDLVMPRKDGLATIFDLKQESCEAHILVLTSFLDDDQVFPALKAGALGYLLKDTAPHELLQAIRQVHKGEVSLHPIIARKVINELNRPPTLPLTTKPLTPRELEVLVLVAQGLPNQEVAERLAISERTVRTHVSNILDKLHLASRLQATLYALQEGLVDPKAN